VIDLSWLRIRLRNYRAQLRLCLRVTVAALLAFVLAQPLDVPLSGLWAVLTAIVVTQISVGGSLQATTEYVVGTIGGAIYASAIALLAAPARCGKGALLRRSRRCERRSSHTPDKSPRCAAKVSRAICRAAISSEFLRSASRSSSCTAICWISSGACEIVPALSDGGRTSNRNRMLRIVSADMMRA